ncbi:hypothetical protein ONS95_001993 [Cadophora gregata]|uniref:uncharacterized protein n=1 Tax=Cadophora gregata TaxID=51156 RepID=UPI0026DC4190|nr:uncharacterized protein ONS95_001993 [Cadophora gregata]KAK0111649.1 hypothetical protein ONS95_001993 [Cadophora gregata]KAK0111876.1 hypothetical protein ONS96_001145 [Cadophora gregata f. sp. sojae]
MKPTSPLSLLLFLQLASAAPLPETLFPSDCHYTSCAGFRSALLSSKPNTPPTRLTSPHFPAHQLSSPDTLDVDAFDNRPFSPSEDIRPSVALTSDRPLSSSFLLSLANPASSPSIQKAPQSTSSEDSLASKPTSALPNLRREDAERYWASLRPASGKKEDEAVEDDGQRRKVVCGATGFIAESYVSFHGVRLARDYSDLMVVGIVVLFLAAVVALELVERIEHVGRSYGRRRTRRGQIFLEDDETLAYIVKKPVSLQADSLQYQISLGQHQDEKEAFQYDSDAAENV